MSHLTNYDKCIRALSTITNELPTIVEQFVDWYDDGGWEDDGLNDEFLIDDAVESSFIDWIRENNTIATHEKGQQIWQLCHNALQNIQPPSGDEKQPSQAPNTTNQPQKTTTSIIVNLLSVAVEAQDKKLNIESSKSPVKKRISIQSSSMLPPSIISGGFFGKKGKNQAQDILTVEYLGYLNNNYPLLLHFVDSYMRCQLNEWIINGKKQQTKFSSTEFFKTHCRNAEFRSYFKLKTSQSTIDVIRTAIESYQSRVLPCFQFMEPIYKIDGHVLDISQYMFEMARIARNTATMPIHNLTTIIPIQIDFLIVNSRIKHVLPDAMKCTGVSALFSDDDDEENEESKDEEHEDGVIPQDIDKLLKSKNIAYYSYDKPLRDMLRCTEDIKHVVENKRSRRTVFVIDRRKNKNKDSRRTSTIGDKLYLFKPKKFNRFEENDQELVHSALHHNSISSVLPRMVSKSKDDDFNVREGLRGQMFVVSFHIVMKEEIRCYLFYQGQCFRFYGEDLINVLPMFFYDSKKARQTLLKMHSESKWRDAFNEFCDTFVDKRFDRFYYGLTGKKPRINVVH
eukprot:14924_1